MFLVRKGLFKFSNKGGIITRFEKKKKLKERYVIMKCREEDINIKVNE